MRCPARPNVAAWCLASIQRALGEEMLADALHQFGEHRISHGVERARAWQRHLIDRRDRARPFGHDQHAICEEYRFGNRVGDQQHGLRSEEHTSELQSLAYLVCRLLLEKKKKNKNYQNIEKKKIKKKKQKN